MIEEKRLLLVGCGILEKEVTWLIEKNRWPVDTVFLPSALHVDFGKLAHSLTAALDRHRERNSIVLYGCCHPLMDHILEDADTFRTPGQNCVDILLGNAVFTEELGGGAFFLLEDWARNWRAVMIAPFGTNVKGLRFVFQRSHTCVLALRTPGSGDFTAQAQEFADVVGLPLRWMDVSLDHLEAVLHTTITRRLRTCEQ